MTDRDYLLRRVGVDSSALAVMKSFGKPNRISKVYNHYTDPDSDAIYTYDDLAVLLSCQNKVVAFDVTAAKLSTVRGIKVGNSINEVRKKYGIPSDEGENYLSYFEPNSALGITFRLHRKKVYRIYIGWHGD